MTGKEGYIRMTTVREARVSLAVDVINDQIAMGNLHPAEPKSELRSKAHVTLVANHLIDVLFPDHVFDDIEIPAAGPKSSHKEALPAFDTVVQPRFRGH